MIERLSSAFSSPLRPPSPKPAAPSSPAETVIPKDSVAHLPGGFVIKSGEQRYELPSQGQVIVGRADGSDLQLNDPSVSRRHALMQVKDGKVLVCDVGSSFGTTINGHRLEVNQWYAVPPGATIHWAQKEMKLENGAPPSRLPDQGQQMALQGALGAVPGFLLQAALGGPGFELRQDGTYSLGRKPDNSLPLKDPTISRNHAQLRLHEGKLALQDLGSTNGSKINDKPVQPGQWTPLPPNATIALGDTLLQLSPLPPSSALEQGAAAAWGAAANLVGGAVGAALRTGLQLADLATLSQRQHLESKESLLESIQSARAELGKESGIVDLPRGVPTLVLSDLHARRDFLMKTLEHEVEGVKVFDLLKQGKLNLVCVGDGMHAEGRAAERWRQAEQDMLAGRPSPAMQQEMVEGFGTMKMIMELKSEFPENFHFLRGNHDEIQGNFAKYARVLGEGPMVQHWVKANLGEDFLQEYARFEESLPLVVRGQGFVASHAAPGGTIDREAVEQRDPKAFAQLAWTENRNWNEADPKVRERFQQNLQEVGRPSDRWLVGHRPVDQGNFRSQFDGQLVQINAPNDFVVALVPANGSFHPERDVFSLGRTD